MRYHHVKQLITAMEITEGAGVTVHRTIGTPQCRNLDPFLLLDHFGSNNPDEYIAGFPDHPHRGFITLTYMLDGHMLHKDSMGNEGDLVSGGAQWMKAASGVIHSEMPQQTRGLMRGFQLWINLPASEKMGTPGYQEFLPDALPVVEQEGVRVKILAGSYAGIRGPIEDPHTDVHYFHVTLVAGRSFEMALGAEYAAFIYVFAGDATMPDAPLSPHSLAVLGEGEGVAVTAGDAGAEFILVAGIPLGEPIVQYGPFVMNSNEEVHQAMADYRAGTLVRDKGELHNR